MKRKNLILCLMGLVLNLTTVQVESYNFRSANRSMAPSANQKYVQPNNNRGVTVRRDQVPSEHFFSTMDGKGKSFNNDRSLADRRGLLPHQRGRVGYGSPVKHDTTRKMSQNLDASNHSLEHSMNVAKESWDQNWRYQKTIPMENIAMTKNFQPKGNNQDLTVVPYRGEFYSRGGKPVAIDPGLLGRWK